MLSDVLCDLLGYVQSGYSDHPPQVARMMYTALNPMI